MRKVCFRLVAPAQHVGNQVTFFRRNSVPAAAKYGDLRALSFTKVQSSAVHSGGCVYLLLLLSVRINVRKEFAML